MAEEFYRIKRLPPYVIAEVNAMRHAARREGRDIIDLGMGNPDHPPPQHVIDALLDIDGHDHIAWGAIASDESNNGIKTITND